MAIKRRKGWPHQIEYLTLDDGQVVDRRNLKFYNLLSSDVLKIILVADRESDEMWFLYK